MENSEWLDWQAKPGIEPGTSRLPALRAEPLRHLWGDMVTYYLINLNFCKKKLIFHRVSFFFAVKK